MGVGTRTKAWRFTDINKDYQVGHFPLSVAIILTLSSVLPHLSISSSSPNTNQ